jgi:hypothetical protein
MRDICKGMPTDYGSTQILESCRLPLLAPNGSYFIFTDMALRTDLLTNASSLTVEYMHDYQVLSQVHTKISMYLVASHNKFIEGTKKDLIIALVVWILAVIFLIICFVWGTMLEFIRMLNLTKNIITILPISVAKTLPKVTDYCHTIIRSNYCFPS